MAEFIVVHTPALAGAKRGRFGCSPGSEAGVKIKALPEGRVLHVLAAVDSAGVEAQLKSAGMGDVRSCSSGQWFAVDDRAASDSDLGTLNALVADAAMVCDQSHGRVRIGMQGPRATDVLSKGTAVDLHDTAFPVGHSAMTLIGHIGVNLARIGHDAFELIVLRGFAESLWSELIQMSLEFGVVGE